MKYLQQGVNLAEKELDREETITAVLNIQFEAAQNQHYGFDGQYNETALQPQYETLTHPDGTYYIAWKSVKKGTTEQVIAIAANEDADTTQTTYTFKTAEGLPVASSAENDNEMVAERSRSNNYNLTLPTSNTPGKTHINAYKTIPAQDSTQSPTKQLAGRLNLAVYENQTFTLQIIPMGDATAAPAQVQTALNDIYSQAAITWQVSAYEGTFNPADWDTDSNNLVDAGGTQFLSNYTKEMNNIISAFKTQANPDRETHYLFLVPGFSNDLAGFMPLGRNFGFIATKNATAIANTMAHELGHGAFVLYHPFSEKSPYYRPEGSTDNLMDYSDGTFLNKYQWDLIHDPRRIVRVAQDEGEGEFIYGITWLGNYLWGLAPDNQESQIETDRTLFKHVFENYDKYFNDSKTKNVNLDIEAHKSWSVRKASHQGIAKKIFKGVKEEKTSFSLHDEGIYFEEYTLEEETYKVAVYSKIEVVNLNQDIRIKSFKSLRYNKSIKVGYTKDYGLIVFYGADGKMQMVLQIIGGKTPKEAVTQWMNYLGLLLPSEEQQEEDEENSIQEMLKVVNLYALEKLNEIWGEEEIIEEDNVKISTEKILKETKTATEIATKYTSGTACNICVRAALYIIKNDSALFPTTGSGYNDPKNNYISREIKGYISPDGRAYYIKSDFNKLSSKPELNERFVEIPKNDQEEWVDYFQRLQNEADKGTIIIGVMLNSTGNVGHIMMITPGGLIEINDKEKAWGKSFVSRGIKKVPSVLECGNVVRDNRAPLCRNVDRKGAIERLKWYKYKK